MAAPPAPASRRLPIAVPLICWPLILGLIVAFVQAPLPAPANAPLKLVKPLKTWSALASWYGAELDGHTTASGEPFDMYAATAAHVSLPLGSLLNLVNPRTGRSQIVRVNDRGPFAEGRELDVSYLVATRLGLLHRGVGLLRIELLEVPARP
jgi:rare lipoprotein A